MEAIPNYVLYGEAEKSLFPDYLHIESIRARSQHHGWKFRPHRHHNLYQFFYISKGGGYVSIEEKKHSLHNGLLIVMPPLAVHGFNFLPGTQGWVLTIPDIYLQNILKEKILLLEHLIIFQCDALPERQKFNDIFTEISKEHITSEPLRDLNLQGLTALLLTRIIRSHPPKNPPAQTSSRQHRLLNSFQNRVNEKFKQRLSVAEYASELGITPTHLSRICRNILDVPASSLIDQRSLLEAKRLLIYTSMTIAEISYELGYCDPAHFSKFFHNKTTQKPSGFRRDFMKQA